VTGGTPNASPLPFATIVIPTRNEGATIGRCLAAVAAQDYPHDRLEVLVLDGRSRDGTREAVSAAAAAADFPIRLLDNPPGTVPAALNRALELGGGSFLVRVDGHSEPEPSYVRRCVDGAREPGVGLAGGWVEAVGTTAVGRAIAAAFASPAAMGNAASWQRPGQPTDVASVPCGAYRVEALREIGGFDDEQRANQDYEANFRLRQAGWRVVLLPEVRFAYTTRSSLRRLARQFARYGFYRARTMIKHPASIRIRHLAPAGALIVGVALAASAPFSQVAALVLAGGAALYVVGLVAAAFVAGRGLGRTALLLPLVFATMHASWGAGNVVGLVRWLPRRARLRAAASAAPQP
jgi:succinoglycan biosynthesis protein ExoA